MPENNSLIYDPVAAALSGQTMPPPVVEVPVQQTVELPQQDSEDEPFSYDGYQVVRGEFFAHIYEPSITFNNCKVNVNTACLNRLPAVSYVQFLVNPEDKKMVVRPCSEDEKDSFRWCSESNGKRKPKQITCRIFFAKIVNLMNWNPHYRFKLLGKIVRSGDEQLVVFDLTATETYPKVIKEGEKPRTSRTPIFPAEWQNQFGLPVEEHRKLLQVNIFNGYTVFGLGDEQKPREGGQDNKEEVPVDAG